MTRMIATVLGVGYLRPAPGTWGSLAALPLFWGLYELVGFFGTLLAIAVVTALGTWAIAAETRGKSDHDPSEIVIDEVAGQWIALLTVAYGAHFTGSDIIALWPGWVAGFVFFRLFDIWKPWLVGRADRMGTAWGVMLDDLIAGAFAALATFVLGALWHVVFL
ncbi:Phosphatidylglycerophosphatase A [Roseivivax sp. THAF40]|uniref:phosphatidylglycerophosphatase A family protein n=1 Tax=unclassified Roseivivax TaxID=2639302 RepID=UPI00126872F5|nr:MULTISPECIES: phosphatidylglycerophosphatase A [unclassified Roseivivax]QFS83470.1 Phosphatidylglycerophosphatase A [Roseivivax sp. THAF197b]QFT47215.1 Phosphatidylglycerophosphatase A [Roseivivax sp. THAF40]